MSNGLESDKSVHGFYQVYTDWLAPYKHKKVNMLEIGTYNGYSLVWFSQFFTHPETRIYGLDLVPIVVGQANNVTFKLGSQDDAKVASSFPCLDVVLDDASHIAPLTRRTFDIYWPKVVSGGAYIIEDIHPDVLPEMFSCVNNILKEFSSQIKEYKIYKKDTHPQACGIMLRKQ